MTIDLKKLKAPFKNVSWRLARATQEKVGKRYPEGTKGQFLAYIDARDVMDRLDDVVGSENWQNKMEIMPNGSMKCSLSIKINDNWITKEDGAGSRLVEKEKSAYSDALKRSGVLWGIARYLYDVKTTYVPIDQFGSPTIEGKKTLDKCLKDIEIGIYDNVLKEEDLSHDTKEEKKEIIKVDYKAQFCNAIKNGDFEIIKGDGAFPKIKILKREIQITNYNRDSGFEFETPSYIVDFEEITKESIMKANINKK